MVILAPLNNTLMHKTSPAPPAAVLDITGEICPMTYVRTRLALDGLPPGARLLVLLKGDDPRINVAANARRQGHQVLSCEDGPDGITRLLLQRK